MDGFLIARQWFKALVVMSNSNIYKSLSICRARRWSTIKVLPPWACSNQFASPLQWAWVTWGGHRGGGLCTGSLALVARNKWKPYERDSYDWKRVIEGFTPSLALNTHDGRAKRDHQFPRTARNAGIPPQHHASRAARNNRATSYKWPGLPANHTIIGFLTEKLCWNRARGSDLKFERSGRPTCPWWFATDTNHTHRYIYCWYDVGPDRSAALFYCPIWLKSVIF